MKKIILAQPRGFCAGVKRAIDIVERAIKKYGSPIYVRHEIVHNKCVVDRLSNIGAIFVDELNEIQDKTRPVIYSAHGVPKSVPKKEEDESGAVLIRAIQPQQGIKHMVKNRKTDVISNLANGPGKLTQAMQITLKQYDLDLTKNSSLFIIDGKKPTKIMTKPRVGIKTGIDKLWNFSYKL